MKEDSGFILLDVRRTDEFEEGHIPGAINIPNESIGTEEIAELPDQKQTIYVYCRSGNRSKQASQKLVDLGYTNVIEFGGIIDYSGEIEKGRASDYRFTDKIKYYQGYTSANGKLKSGTKVYELLKLSNEKSDYTEQDIIERKKTIIEEFVQYLKDNELME